MIVLTLFSGNQQLCAQEYNLSHFSVSEGLSSSTVYKIFQCSKGFLWAGTAAGVDRFDGGSFVNYSMDDGLPDTEVIDITEDSKGRVWFVCLNGKISFFDKNKLEIPSFSAQYFSDKKISSVLGHSNGDLYISTRENGVYRFRNDTLVKMYPAPDKTVIYRIFEDSSGTIWGETYFGFIQLRNGRLVDLPLKDGSYNSRIRATPWFENNIFFASSTGLGKFDGKTEKFLDQKHIRMGPTDVLSFLLVDRNTFWMGTIKGAYLFSDLQLSSKPLVLLKDHVVTSLIRDHEGNIWFGTFDNGLYFLPDISFRSYTVNSGLLHEHIYRISGDKKGNIYAGDKRGNFYKISKGKLFSYPTLRGYHQGIYSILPLKNEVLFASMRDIAVLKNDKYRLLPHNIGIRCMEQGQGDTIYLCNPHQGFYRQAIDSIYQNKEFPLLHHDIMGIHSICLKGNKVYMANSSKVFEYKNEHFEEIPIPGLNGSGRITSLQLGPDTGMWISTTGKGVFYYKDKSIKHFNKQNGLPSNLCNKLSVSDEYIWIATNKGVAGIDHLRKNQVKVFTNENGLISNEVNDIFEDDHGSLWVATNKGISYINLNEKKHYKISPPVFVESVIINDSTYPLTSHYTLAYNQNKIGIEFKGIGFRSRGINKYEYTLEGFDTAWYTTNNAGIQYASLSPGQYSFKVKAVNSEGTSSTEPAVISISIQKAFWQTGLFLGFAVFIVLGVLTSIVYIMIRQIKKRQERRYELKKKINALEIQALRSQMNPHFLFNSLNAIQHFIFNKDKKNAMDYLSKFARLMRLILTYSKETYILLQDEIDFLRLYLDIEVMRFEEKLKYNIRLDDNIDAGSTYIPAMVIQPMVENAIKHGLLHKTEGGCIDIVFSTNGDSCLKCTIIDNGVGREKAKEIGKRNKHLQSGTGIKATIERLALMQANCPKDEIFKFKDMTDEQGNPSGSTVELILPKSQ